MFTQATSAGVSALTYRSIDQTNTPYGKQKEPFRSLVKNDLCVPVLRRASKKHEPASGVAAGASAAYRFCTSKITIKSDLYPPRNIFWPYTLQPPRRQEFQPVSQLSPIVTNTVPWIICESFHFQPTNFTCIPSICTAKYTLKARWFVFALESLEEPEEQNMTTFTVVVFSNHVWKKSSQLLPARVALPMHLPVIFYTGVKVQKYDKVRIPLATKTYLQSSCWSSICGLDSLLFPALVLLQATKLLQTPSHAHPCLHPSCSHEPPQLVFRPSPINRLIFTQTHQTVKGRNHFALSWRTMHACQLFDSCRFPKKHEPASGVAAGVSAAYRFCTSKITIKSDLYPSRNIFWPYTLQPPRRQEFQPASQLSPIVTNTVPWIICESFVTSSQQILLASLLYAQPNTPWKHVDLSLH